jgi:hypothetical protein
LKKTLSRSTRSLRRFDTPQYEINEKCETTLNGLVGNTSDVNGYCKEESNNEYLTEDDENETINNNRKISKL